MGKMKDKAIDEQNKRYIEEVFCLCDLDMENDDLI